LHILIPNTKMLEYHSIYLPRYLEILNGLGMLKVCILHMSNCRIFGKEVYVIYVKSGLTFNDQHWTR